MPTAQDFSLIPMTLHERAHQALISRDASGFMSLVPGHEQLRLLVQNLALLEKRGMYEVALVDAYIAGDLNNHGCPSAVLNWLFSIADCDRLRGAGAPLPGPGPYQLYRGVAGRGQASGEFWRVMAARNFSCCPKTFCSWAAW
jgi:hypothetical protein